jgi:hypothetical protein
LSLRPLPSHPAMGSHGHGSTAHDIRGSSLSPPRARLSVFVEGWGEWISGLRAAEEHVKADILDRKAFTHRERRSSPEKGGTRKHSSSPNARIVHPALAHLDADDPLQQLQSFLTPRRDVMTAKRGLRRAPAQITQLLTDFEAR